MDVWGDLEDWIRTKKEETGLALTCLAGFLYSERTLSKRLMNYSFDLCFDGQHCFHQRVGIKTD